MQANGITATLTIGKSGVTAQSNVGGAVATGTKDYEKLKNKPSIEHVTLEGNKDFEDLGLEPLTNSEILSIIKSVFN